mmetsp:Transcript_26307/g.70163  ORF Transcript_26307/g.70163 Transcript_26307/m.70163 type:complete len:265 (+) Transcript_26307:586-1380(+)
MGMGPAIPVQFWGTYAEYIVLAEKHITKVPAGIGMEQAAAIPLVGMTVAQAFRYAGFEPVQALALATTEATEGRAEGRHKGRGKREDGRRKRVLIHAAAGGVGHVAVQYASRVLGLEVVGTASPGASTDLAIKSGATAVVDYRSHKFEEADAVVGQGGVDVIFDVIGFEYESRAFNARLLDRQKGGVYINIFKDEHDLPRTFLGVARWLLGLGPTYGLAAVLPEAAVMHELAKLVEDGSLVYSCSNHLALLSRRSPDPNPINRP